MIRKAATVSILVLSLAAAFPAALQAQTPPSAGTQQQGTQFTSEQLDQLLAPIALYPDSLLSQILMAATYPLEIVEAERWVKDPAHAGLKGDALDNALQNQNWDPSVKSLVPFPSVLQNMGDKLDWTQKVGDAFLAQQNDVMDSVQRLRQKAQSAGNLKSNSQQMVTTQGQTIVIQPANPEVVYVPTYQPTVVYGAWPYPAYAPAYFPPPPGAAFVSGFFWGVGVAASSALFGWSSFDWGGHDVNINVNHYNQINRNFNRIDANSNVWRHDPAHRGNVPYRNANVRQQYGNLGGRSPVAATNREFRNHETRGALNSQLGQGQRGQGQRNNPGARDIGGDLGSGARRTEGGLQQRAQTNPQRNAGRSSSSAFEGIGHADATRQAADRGRFSRGAEGGSFGGGGFHGGGSRGGGGGGGFGRHR